MSRSIRSTSVKFSTFVVVMAMMTGFLFLIFGQYRTGSTNGYTAVFANASRLKSGDSVRAAGIRVGTVTGVSLLADKKVLVNFDTDRTVVLTEGTTAAVRYLNLVGDRYLELKDAPGSTRILSPGAQIPIQRTAPALDLDLLLGGLRPVIKGLNPQDVNALTSSLIQIFQGQGRTFESLLSKTSSFTNALADNKEVIQRVIDNLNTVLHTIDQEGGKFSGMIDRLERLTTELAADRDPIGEAIDSLDNGTASLADLLGRARAPLRGNVAQLNRIAPLLYEGRDQVDGALKKAPENYRKMIRTGAYGSVLNWYVCELSWRVTDFQNRTVVAPWFKQEGGRCAEPNE
jgi:phospholipid/cholesterol/gamma-HCH transport system substrate-binding protein